MFYVAHPFSLFPFLLWFLFKPPIYFAHNVSEDSGFINTKKYWNGDSDLCWAATASNMLQWWQNNSSGHSGFRSQRPE